MTLKKEIPTIDLAVSGTSSLNGVSVDDYNKAFCNTQEEVCNTFTPKKLQSEKLSGIYAELSFYDTPEKKIQYSKRADRVNECGSFLEFHLKGDKFKLAKANFCKDRLCPMCSWRRSLKIFGQVSQIMDILQERGDYAFIFLTLTVRNCPAEELKETIDALNNGWRSLYHDNKIFKNTVLGTFRTLEITRNAKENTYQPHLHTILVVRADYYRHDYLTKNDWQEMWKKACGLDYEPIIDVRKIKADGNIKKAVAEVSKYAVKGSDLLHGDLDEMCDIVRTFLEALYSRRLCSFTGIFKKIKQELNLDDIESGDLVNTDNEDLRSDVASAIIRYGWRYGYYEQFQRKGEQLRRTNNAPTLPPVWRIMKYKEMPIKDFVIMFPQYEDLYCALGYDDEYIVRIDIESGLMEFGYASDIWQIK